MEKIKKEITISLIIILFALIEAKTRLWSGYAPNLLLLGLICLTGSVTILELLFYTLIGFLFLAGPVISQELLVIIVIVSFFHFLRLFVFGPSTLLTPFFSAAAILLFYLETIGFAVFMSPLFLLEICLVSVLFGFVPVVLLSRFPSMRS